MLFVLSFLLACVISISLLIFGKRLLRKESCLAGCVNPPSSFGYSMSSLWRRLHGIQIHRASLPFIFIIVWLIFVYVRRIKLQIVLILLVLRLRHHTLTFTKTHPFATTTSKYKGLSDLLTQDRTDWIRIGKVLGETFNYDSKVSNRDDRFRRNPLYSHDAIDIWTNDKWGCSPRRLSLQNRDNQRRATLNLPDREESDL